MSSGYHPTQSVSRSLKSEPRSFRPILYQGRCGFCESEMWGKNKRMVLCGKCRLRYPAWKRKGGKDGVESRHGNREEQAWCGVQD